MEAIEHHLVVVNFLILHRSSSCSKCFKISLPRDLRILQLRLSIVKLIEHVAIVWPAMLTGTAKVLDLPSSRDRTLYIYKRQPRQPKFDCFSMACAV